MEEKEKALDLLELIKHRRSIRKYENRKVEREKLEMILEAGIYAPNPGGRQGTKILMLEDAAVIDKIGIVNASCENRNWGGNGVSAEQPSIIDDLSIKSGFYGCQALGIVCTAAGMAKKVNGIGAAFVCAENMVLQASALGVSSCIVGRAEDTFRHPEMEKYAKWMEEQECVPVVFVCLGYIHGQYPKAKARNEGRIFWIEE